LSRLEAALFRAGFSLEGFAQRLRAASSRRKAMVTRGFDQPGQDIKAAEAGRI
jgi:hypothetical protein